MGRSTTAAAGLAARSPSPSAAEYSGRFRWRNTLSGRARRDIARVRQPEERDFLTEPPTGVGLDAEQRTVGDLRSPPRTANW